MFLPPPPRLVAIILTALPLKSAAADDDVRRTQHLLGSVCVLSVFVRVHVYALVYLCVRVQNVRVYARIRVSTTTGGVRALVL